MNLGVYSLWTGTPDFKLTRGLAMLFSAAIAYGKEAFHEIELVTDHKGMEIADRLGWRCSSYSLGLEGFCPKVAQHVWMLGKIRAQQLQTRPFVHVDLDFVLFQTLPARLTRESVCVQSKDHPKSYKDTFVRKIVEYVGIVPHSLPYNLGIIGWNDLAFKDAYCAKAWELCLKAAAKFNHGGCVSIVCEQLLLGQMARARRVNVECAIPLPKHAVISDMGDVEFTHLWGKAKSDPHWLAQVERRFEHDHPLAYRRFLHGWPLLNDEPDHCSPYITNHGVPPVMGCGTGNHYLPLPRHHDESAN